ncbi:hypothetical protein V5O48_008635 [Marasmius crinis-equi]|uniref:Uncharacterized protein n=1 Tax=Marasmius crinis-equi TaxID=585013 RepID=A0ABR3FDG2_9AGAR
MPYFLRSRASLKGSIAAARTPITPLSAPFDFAARAAVFELRAVERHAKHPTASELFDGDELTDLSDLSDSEPEEEPTPPLPQSPRPKPFLVSDPRGKRKRPLSPTEPENAPPTETAPSIETASPTDAHQPPRRLSSRHRKRAKTRKARKDDKANAPKNPSPRTIDEALRPAQAVQVPLKAAELDAAYGGHTGKLGKATIGDLKEREKEYDVDELVEKKDFFHFKWDGVTPTPIIDDTGGCMGSLAGRPTRGDYPKAMDRCHRSLMAAGEEARLVGIVNNKKRGGFPAITKGVTMGMGSRQPVLLKPDNQHPGVDIILQRLLDSPDFKRLSSYHNSSFNLWGPELFDKYTWTVGKMHQHPETSHLPLPFKDSVFTACAFNFGGQVRTYKHRDHLNWAFGWCAITALGNFDPTKSARLVLWELKLVIDFPPGSTVLIPSAVITHSNTRIAEGQYAFLQTRNSLAYRVLTGDERTSFTQYSAGAIFRWAENSCMTEGELKAANPKVWAERQAAKAGAVAERARLYTKLADILDFE